MSNDNIGTRVSALTSSSKGNGIMRAILDLDKAGLFLGEKEHDKYTKGKILERLEVKAGRPDSRRA